MHRGQGIASIKSKKGKGALIEYHPTYLGNLLLLSLVCMLGHDACTLFFLQLHHRLLIEVNQEEGALMADHGVHSLAIHTQ